MTCLGCIPAHANGGAAIEVQREVCIPYGDDSGRGRLDLLIRQGSETLCVIEVKTKSFSDKDLRKQRWYSEFAPRAERIFWPLTQKDSIYVGLGFSWFELCISLRRLTPAVAANRNHLTAALILAFVGAVEQNVLGLAQSEEDLGALPRTVAHLRQFVEPN